MIFFNQGMLLLGSNHFLIYNKPVKVSFETFYDVIFVVMVAKPSRDASESDLKVTELFSVFKLLSTSNSNWIKMSSIAIFA